MIQRCTNHNNKSYHNYGGREITVCKEWRKFENFLEDMGEPPKGYQIDRINNNEGYYQANCRWATRKQQQRNTRNNHLISYKGKIQCLSAWAEKIGIPYGTLKSRFYCNWSIEKALTTPVKKYKKYKRKKNGNRNKIAQ